MNSQTDQIKALIGEIDEVLRKPSPRLPWVATVETTKQRQVLERVRRYLVSLAEQLNSAVANSSTPENLTTPRTERETPAAADFNRLPRETEIAQQILQAVLAEMSYLRANLTEPIQEDLLVLRQEQQALVSEIKQLEARRQQHYSLAQQQANQQQVISEFVQVLMGRLQESLARDVSQTFANLEARLVNSTFLGAANDPELLRVNNLTPTEATYSPESGAGEELPALTAAQRLEQMRRLQAQSDRLLMTLDSTLSVVFEALQRNLQSYQESLSQGLDRMHNLGQQGEVMFTALVNHLAEQLGREASSYVHRHLETLDTEPRPTAGASPREGLAPQSAEEAPTLLELEEPPTSQDQLPYPGTEVSATRLAELRRTREEVNRRSSSVVERSQPQAAPESAPPTPVPPKPGLEEAAALPLGSKQTDGELEDLYASLFSQTPIVAEAESESATLPVSSVAPPSPPVTPEPTFAVVQESEGLEDFLAAEDSEFAVSHSLDELTFNTQELFGERASGSESGEVTAVAAEATEPESKQRETLADLSEAFSEEVPSSSVPKIEAAIAPLSQISERSEHPAPNPLTEDTYEQASPDEDLLPVEGSVEEVDEMLLLDNNALQLLQADLYSLEGLEFSDSQEGYDAFDPGNESAFSLSAADNPFVASTQEEITTFEDLFADFSEMEPSAGMGAVTGGVGNTALFPGEESGSQESGMTLEDILASLTEAEERSGKIQNKLTNRGDVTRGVDTSSGEKKKVDFFESQKVMSEPKDPVEAFSTEEAIKLEDDFDFADALPYLPSRPSVQPQAVAPERPLSHWYLGIDFGTTGLSAALLNRLSGDIYPIYWELGDAHRFSFRLPSVAYLSTEGVTKSEVVVKSVGDPEIAVEVGGLLLQNFKLPLKVGIPFPAMAGAGVGAGDLYEPALQWRQQQAVSLTWLLQGLRALLATLNPQEWEKAGNQGLPMGCGAVGLEPTLLEAVLGKLGGVILGTPAGWSEAYRFNLREAVLAAGLVAHSSHIFVIEDAIAALLSELPHSRGEGGEAALFASASSQLKGGTLIVNAGALATELVLVDLPVNLQDLTYADFTCQYFPYAGNALDQDIICQVLMQGKSFGPPTGLPQPGEPDLVLRYQLQQWLESSPFGQGLLAGAKHLKAILQHQERFTLKVGNHRWEVKRRDLESKVLIPFAQRLNRELNALLSQVGMSPVGVEQAICTGGTASWPAIARWLRQKLPNAIIIQEQQRDAGGWEFGEWVPSQTPSLKSKIGRVAWGLASLPLYPQVLDGPRQQYSDYFLLWELMRVVGEQRLSLGEITRLLEGRGINTRACQSRILAILEGKFPEGLFPSVEDAALLAPGWQNPDDPAIEASSLFHKELDRDYRLNLKLRDRLCQYLNRLVANSQQKLQEPLTVDFGIATDNDP